MKGWNKTGHWEYHCKDLKNPQTWPHLKAALVLGDVPLRVQKASSVQTQAPKRRRASFKSSAKLNYANHLQVLVLSIVSYNICKCYPKYLVFGHYSVKYSIVTANKSEWLFLLGINIPSWCVIAEKQFGILSLKARFSLPLCSCIMLHISDRCWHRPAAQTGARPED